mmetsp:Transcript_17748/g.26590  ORF Transcript_17748/g.26590 Transcript_17748/m.26590 type:complete len:262 (-) Transcript_17748:35-820(-)
MAPYIERWKKSDKELKDFTDKLPKKHSFRVDFDRGKFVFVDAKNISLAQANVKLILSYSTVSKTVVAGWQNPSVPSKNAAPEMKGIPRVNVSPQMVEAIARRIGDRAKSQYIYKAINKTNWVYLGLSDLKELKKKERIQYNGATGWMEFAVMIIARLRKVLSFTQVPPVSIAKAYHDAGILFLQQAQGNFSENKIAVDMLKNGARLFMTLAKELKTWSLDRRKAHEPQHVASIVMRLLEYEQAVILSKRASMMAGASMTNK